MLRADILTISCDDFLEIRETQPPVQASNVIYLPI